MLAQLERPLLYPGSAMSNPAPTPIPGGNAKPKPSFGANASPQPSNPKASPADPLSRLEAKLDRIEARLARLDPVLEQAPGLLDMAGDVVDEASREFEIHERTLEAAKLLERLTRPETMQKVRELVDLAEAMPDTITVAMDSLDSLAQEARDRGIDIGELVPRVANFSSIAIRALQSAQSSDPSRPGVIQVLRAVRDPDISRAFGFALEMARSMGRDITADDHSHHALPPSR